MTDENNPIYPEREQDAQSGSTPDATASPKDDFFFVPADMSGSFSAPSIIDNYDPSTQESVQNTAPVIIENYDHGINQEE